MKTNTKTIILQYIKDKGKVRPYDLQKHLKISRVAVHKQLLNLCLEETIEKHGSAPHVYYTLGTSQVKEKTPHYLWDYDYNELKKTEQGRIKILERKINYEPGKGEKINLADVKKYWDKLKLFPNAKKLMELLIWNKIITKTKFPSEQELLGMDDDEFFAYCMKKHSRLLKENKGKLITSFQLKRELYRKYEKLLKNI